MPVLLLHPDYQRHPVPRAAAAGLLRPARLQPDDQPDERAQRPGYPHCEGHPEQPHRLRLLRPHRHLLLRPDGLWHLRLQLQAEKRGVHLHHGYSGHAHPGDGPGLPPPDYRHGHERLPAAPDPALRGLPLRVLLHVQLHAVLPAQGADRGGPH